MKWMKERDLLIAQTMDFVQSVTGKRPNAEMSTAVPPNAAPSAASTAIPAAVAPATEAIIALAMQVAARPKLPVPTVIEVPPVPPPLPPAAMTVIEVPPASAQPPQFAKLDIRGDFQSEVRARVANFRANQQRFIKEREEYCSSTMAKVRAAIRDTNELPRSDK